MTDPVGFSATIVSTAYPSPGVLAFRRLEPGDRKEDEIVFGSETPDILDGAALLVGRPPDVPAIVPLTAPPLPADYPAPVTAEEQGPFQAGAIAWEVLSGEVSLDRPPGLCCPDSGVRADEGEVFLTLRLRGRVDGSQYGQATVSTDVVRLLVGGEAVAPFRFDGRPNVPEGEAVEFESTWLVPDPDPGLALQLLAGSGVEQTVPLAIADAVSPGLAPGP
jgi:hypothetical protein